MMSTEPADGFDPSFASIGEWAALYRSRGLQIVPAYSVGEKPSWKRPRLSTWKEFGENLIPDATFNRWYGGGGEYEKTPNMGVICGRASGNLFVIDLDIYKTPVAGAWWTHALSNNMGIEPETWRQRTGGGGLQLLFRAPVGWECPTNKTTIGVDIRGQGGFAMLPPSRHESGKFYEWESGFSPWEIECDTAQPWLLEAVTAVVEKFGGAPDSDRNSKTQHTESPEAQFNAFGKQIDGREDQMRRIVFGAIVNWYRECPIKPTDKMSEEKMRDAFAFYERNTKSRLPGTQPNAERLEAEGRGISEFRHKWRYAMAQWSDKIARKAAEPPPPRPFEARTEAVANVPPPARQDGRIRFTDFLTLMTEEVVEEPDYIEPGFLGPGMFGLIAGPPKAQKSWLMQEALVAAAIGRKFLCDTFSAPRPLRVFYLQAEMNRKLLRKRARLISYLSPEERQLVAKNLIVSERFHMLLNEDGVKTAVTTIKEAFPDEPPDIIGMDPLANLFDGENENDNTQIMRFLAARIEAVRQQVNPMAAILMAHHATKKGVEELAKDPFVAIRGGGALRGYYDSAIVIYRKSEESRHRKVHFELRSGDSPEVLEVELVNGRFQKAGILSEISHDIARSILDDVRKAWDSGKPLSPYPRASNERRYVVDSMSQKHAVSADSVKALINAWMDNKVVTFRDRVSRGRPAGFEVTGSID